MPVKKGQPVKQIFMVGFINMYGKDETLTFSNPIIIYVYINI